MATIDKGRSILNATDEAANPYGLVLSEEERRYIYGMLNKLDNIANSLYGCRQGWRPQLKAYAISVLEFAVLAAIGKVCGFRATAFLFCIAFLVLQKANLVLTHESIDELLARREREDEQEAKESLHKFCVRGLID